MAGNRAIFDRAMEQYREAARQGNWDEALKSAVRAVQEIGQDVDARTAVAVALFQTQKYERALQVFEELRAADANNIFFLDYIAQANERLGRNQAAASAFRSLAEQHAGRRTPAKEIDALRSALRLQPEQDELRLKLAMRLEEVGATREASGEFLHLSQRLLAANELDEAAEAADIALRLEPGSREIKEQIVSIREAMARAAELGTASQSDERSAAVVARLSAGGMTGALRSQQFQVEKLVETAQKLQETGDYAGAIEQYQRAVEAGLERADVFYSLGMLYQQEGDHRAAVQNLTRAAPDADYALSAHFALGASYKELGQLAQAAQEFEQTIRLAEQQIDLERLTRDEGEELVQMYENTAGIYEQIGDIARASAMYGTIAGILQNKRWGRERAAEFTQRARELNERNMFAKLRTLGTGALTNEPTVETLPEEIHEEDVPQRWGKIRSITDFLREDRVKEPSGPLKPSDAPPVDPLDLIEKLPAPIQPAFAPATSLDTAGLPQPVQQLVVASGTYLDQGLLEAALEASHDVIALDVNYLPIHLRIGEVFERQGRPEEALTKYQLMIDTYRVRGEPEKAIDVYFRFIELAPDTFNARSRLAELLRGAGRTDEAADQLAQVANTYFRIGQSNKALEEYRRLLQWAPKSREIRAQYGLTLLKLERYEAALNEFRTALQLGAPDDPVAIAHLNITLALMGDQAAAIWDSLASLLDVLKQKSGEFAAVQAEYRSALLTQDAPLLHYALAIIQQQANQHSSALLELEQAQAALADAPDAVLHPVLVHQAAADSYIALGQAEAALEQLRRGQAVAGQSGNVAGVKHAFAVPLGRGDLVRRMAEAYAASDDIAGAEKALIEAKQLIPYDRAIYTKLADVYFRQGKLAEAVTQLEELATHYEERQQLDRALEMLEYALKLAPSHINLSSRLARMQLRRGYLDKGVEGLVRAAELQRKAGQLKDAVASLQEAAQVYWTLSDHEHARQLYDKIVQIAPNDIDARQWLALMYTLTARTPEAIAEKKQIARIFAQQRDYDNAIAELHQVIGLDQSDLDAYYLLGDMLMRREEFTQAVQLYNRMLKMDGVEVARVQALASAAQRMLAQRQR
jgi:tetratricopeptide (TPR) repeat protein